MFEFVLCSLVYLIRGSLNSFVWTVRSTLHIHHQDQLEFGQQSEDWPGKGQIQEYLIQRHGLEDQIRFRINILTHTVSVKGEVSLYLGLYNLYNLLIHLMVI
jgi:hypothetical protein